MPSWNLVSIGADNGFVPEDTKPLPGSMLIYHHMKLKIKFHWFFNQNTIIFYKGNAFNSVFSKRSAILFRPGRNVSSHSSDPNKASALQQKTLCTMLCLAPPMCGSKQWQRHRGEFKTHFQGLAIICVKYLIETEKKFLYLIYLMQMIHPYT